MTIGLQKIPRAQKRDITSKIITNLEIRAAKGPAEPVLDAYIVECKVFADALGIHVDGNLAANAERTARLVLLEAADDDVDAWYRHIYTYLDVEALRRTSPNKDAADALRQTAFPDGLLHVDDAIASENRLQVNSNQVRLCNHVCCISQAHHALAWPRAIVFGGRHEGAPLWTLARAFRRRICSAHRLGSSAPSSTQ